MLQIGVSLRWRYICKRCAWVLSSQEIPWAAWNWKHSTVWTLVITGWPFHEQTHRSENTRVFQPTQLTECCQAEHSRELLKIANTFHIDSSHLKTLKLYILLSLYYLFYHLYNLLYRYLIRFTNSINLTNLCDYTPTTVMLL